MSPGFRFPTGARGFTLVELLVVLLIMGLVATALVASRPDALRSQQLVEAGQRLAAVLRTARSRAISSQRTVLVTFDHSKKRAQIASPKGRSWHPIDGVVLPRDLDPLAFYPDGSTTGANLTLQQGERHLVLRVESLTGKVNIDR